MDTSAPAPPDPSAAHLPTTCLPAWGVADLPEPKPLSWRNWKSFIGPGIVMAGCQIGGGEWLFGPEVTARYGGSLMWIATVAIVTQVFYNLEVGRYALYCGEPIFTGFMRKRPGPRFWAPFFLLLSIGVVIPGLVFHGAAVIAALWLNRAPVEADRTMIMIIAYVALVAVVSPVLFGGKIYNMMQSVMTVKVFTVLGFCLIVGALMVSPSNWWNVFSGFLRFGAVPVQDSNGDERVVNALGSVWQHGTWPMISLASVAVLGGFAGYAGGGGLGNSMYSNYVRDKGWGMGLLVGAIPSAIGGRQITLSHLGTVFNPTPANLHRWRGWWRYLLTDQLAIWAPGCFVGMALPALLSMQFAPHSKMFGQSNRFDWAQAVIAADGVQHAPGLSAMVAQLLWWGMLFVGLIVLLPSQMSIVEDVSRRWTDVIWSTNRRVRERASSHHIKVIYYSILTIYVAWSVLSLFLFTHFGTPKLATLVISNLGNVALGITSFQVLWVNLTLLPKPIRPRWYHCMGLGACGVFYLGLAALVGCAGIINWLNSS